MEREINGTKRRPILIQETERQIHEKREELAHVAENSRALQKEVDARAEQLQVQLQQTAANENSIIDILRKIPETRKVILAASKAVRETQLTLNHQDARVQSQIEEVWRKIPEALQICDDFENLLKVQLQEINDLKQLDTAELQSVNAFQRLLKTTLRAIAEWEQREAEEQQAVEDLKQMGGTMDPDFQKTKESTGVRGDMSTKEKIDNDAEETLLRNIAEEWVETVNMVL